ncbi:cellulose binding domain-containing protein [Streptomyces sp. NPDC056188]|uniref:cellulose binding domain-containing protein n=1 Tax=Streptomyces sp. NPDC056188 TaxID=3345740 RepID=UPI0035D7A63B
MPDLPSSKDATEAALLAECWDAVLSYADLCTAGSGEAGQLAAEAFAAGLREVRAAEADESRGRRTPRLPAIPLTLAAVRTTAASWEADGLGDRLVPDLRLWLNSDQAARWTGPPPRRPLALRTLRDLQEPDARLLWLAEVEALPSTVVARRLGLDPARVSEELDQVRTLFRDRCRRNHLDTPMDAECRGYAGLLDAVTRPAAAAGTPEDLSRHLATCEGCAQAAACLRPHGGQLPAALAGGVIGWGGLAYLERRRRAAEVRLGARRPAAADNGGEPQQGAARARIVRGGLLAAAVALSGLALAVSMMPFGGSANDDAHDDNARRPVTDGRPALDPDAGPPAAEPLPSASASASVAASASAAHESSASGAATRSGRENPDPEPQGTASATADGGDSPDPGSDASGTGGTGSGGTGSGGTGTGGPDSGGTGVCRVDYDQTYQWTDGFQAKVTVTTARSLDAWRVAWSFADGQRVGQMWDATVAQSGSRVTATAAEYNKSVPANGTLSFGFLGTWQGRNSAPYDFTLNGHSCATG